MNPGEYEAMAAAERGHWWSLGLRDAIDRCLARRELAPPASPTVLDAGCGTGATLAHLMPRLRPRWAGGFDLAAEAVAHAREAVPDAELWVDDLRAPTLRGAPYDLVLSLDVLYIPGAEASMIGLRRIRDAMRPGARLVLNLPAYDWLYSRHDVAVHTSERYTRRRVRALLDSLGLVPERLSYRLCLPFPLVAARRLLDKPRARRGDARIGSDLRRRPSPAVNRLLTSVLRLENRAIARGAAWPWGSSIFAVARRQGDPERS